MVVVAGPLRDAVNVGYAVALRQCHEFLERQAEPMLDCAIDIKPELLRRDVGFRAEIEHRPVAHQTLTRRQTVALGIARHAGQQQAFARPALLRLDQLVVDLTHRSCAAAACQDAPPTKCVRSASRSVPAASPPSDCLDTYTRRRNPSPDRRCSSSTPDAECRHEWTARPV